MNLADLEAKGAISSGQRKLLEPIQTGVLTDAAVPRPPDLSREKLWLLAPASVEIISELLDGVDKSPGKTTVPERWLARITKFLWMFVEATVPRRPFFIAFRYWFQILFTLTAIVLVLTFFGVWKSAMPMAVKFMGGLVGVYIVTEFIRGFIARRTDVILTSAGTVAAVTGGVVLLYQRVVNGVNLDTTELESTRFTWTLFFLLLIPPAVSILYWILRRLFFRTKPAKLVPLEDKPSWGAEIWRFVRIVGLRVVLLVYAVSVIVVAAYLFLNPKETPEARTKTVPVTIEQPIPQREPSDSEKKVQEVVDSIWERFGH